MKKIRFTYTAILLMCGIIAACSPENKFGLDRDFKEAPKCNGSVFVSVVKSVKASSSYLEENRDDFTATRVDTKTKYTLVSYHGRPDPATGKAKNIGMVQLINPKDGNVQSELFFPDTRVNFAQLRLSAKGDVVYVGVDRNSGKEPFCGILCIPVKGDKFYVGEDGEAELVPYKVDGVSINCIKHHSGDTDKIGTNVMVVAAGGNVALGDEGEAGFTKFEINSEDPTKLGLLAKKTAPNYRGYWFSFGYANSAPLTYTYRTVEDGDLVYKLGALKYEDGVKIFSNTVNEKFINDFTAVETEVLRYEGNTESFARFCTISINKGGHKFIIVSTGTKDGGVQIYRYKQQDKAAGNKPTLTLVDKWDKAAISLSTEVVVGDYYIFAGCGDGIYKLKIKFDTTDSEAATATLEPVTKYTDIGETESGTPCSINYMQLKGSGSNAQIHVAGGYKGYYVLKFTDFAEGKPGVKVCAPRMKD